MYETVDGLFTGICDAIREKDGTTALIQHQDIPERIAAISGGGVVKKLSPFYTYDGGGMKVDDGVVSNLSGKSAIFLGDAFLPGNASWEIKIKFILQEQINHANVLFGSFLRGYFDCPNIEISEDRKTIYANIPDGDTSKWNISVGYNMDVLTGVWYYLKFRFDGEKYIVSLSEDGQAFDDIIQINHGVMYQNTQYSKIQFGGINRSDYRFLQGSIDLNETYIKIGDEVWWGRGVEA